MRRDQEPHSSSPRIAEDPSALPRGATAVAAWAGIFVGTVGAVVLSGWILGDDRLKTIYGPITMKTNGAIGMLLCGGALWSMRQGFRTLGVGCAISAGLLGAATLSQHLVGWDLGIDQLLFSEPSGAVATASPNRMGLIASTSLLLLGVAMLLLFRGTPRAIRHAQHLALFCMTFVVLAIVGYLFGAVELYGIAQFTGISLNTAVALLVLNVGILAAKPTHGPVATFVSRGAAGTLLRRMTLPIFGIPLLFGYIEIFGLDHEVVDRGLGMALLTVSVVVVFLMMLWHTARAIDDSDQERERAEAARDLMLVRERHARDEAERANRLKDHFIATMSHELRTPLNVMLGWTKILETATEREVSARAAALVARNGRVLARLVEDLLDISRASVGQFDLTRTAVHLDTVVKASIDAMLPAAAAKSIDLRSDLRAGVELIGADSERVQQVVSNLLSNAVKFTPTGGWVDVRTACHETTVTVTVADSGIGFDASFRGELFEPFRQADPSSRREHGGLGLGLSIARHLAELHGGSITGSSPGPGLGATFLLTLPRTAVPVTPGVVPLTMTQIS